jgi:uncharacterized protein
VTPGDEEARRAANRAAVLRAYEAVGRFDADAQCLEYAEDAVMEFPFADPPSRLEGRAAIHQMLSAAFTSFHMQLEVTTVHECVDPDRLIFELRSEGELAGKPYANRYVIVYGFKDGKIVSQREYLNPMVIARITGTT